VTDDPVAVLRRDYRPPFLAYLTHEDESGRRSAYELGRRAMTQSVGLLGLVRVHNEVFLDVIHTARTPAAAEEIAQAASSFLFEALASFEMTQRAFLGTAGGPAPAS
jgi:Phosphoserine phosphatase RsbU, N-terminal domain